MIIAENISKSYQENQALKSVSFNINDGELFGFIGPDGAGKTSLFRIIASLLLPDCGSLKVFDYDVVKQYREIRQITGYMPGRFSLYTDLSVEENLDFFASVFGTTLKENYELIKDIYIQIEPFKDRLAGKLSGGMKQKLALSCALIHRPRILILDEPTTGVDAVSRKEFWELLDGLKARGITIIVSTPYMDEALLCDRVALIQEGNILSVDSPGNIIKNYNKKVYSIGSDNNYRLLTDLRAYPTVLHAFAFGQYLHYTDSNPELNINDLGTYLESRNHSNISLQVIEPGIEDIFIDLMETVKVN
ncbi:MAG: ABC transporter ATP-binding protein [Bacteroidales bacterium]|nr:ABC transporter ATP-binding protein [Bacteroidales bacterium]MBN2818282.1 ABC transporter ATP-binding protein [Bacteroidales bacterium]